MSLNYRNITYFLLAPYLFPFLFVYCFASNCLFLFPLSPFFPSKQVLQLSALFILAAAFDNLQHNRIVKRICICVLYCCYCCCCCCCCVILHFYVGRTCWLMSVHVLCLAQVSTFFRFAMRNATSSCQADRQPTSLPPRTPAQPQSLPQPHVTNTHTHTVSAVCKLYEHSKNYYRLSTTKLQLCGRARSLARFLAVDGVGHAHIPPPQLEATASFVGLSVGGAGAAAGGRGSFRFNLCVSRSP